MLDVTKSDNGCETIGDFSLRLCNEAFKGVRDFCRRVGTIFKCCNELVTLASRRPVKSKEAKTPKHKQKKQNNCGTSIY